MSLYRDACLADSPVLFWALDETSGTTAVDGSGSGYAGTYTGGYTLGVAGPPGTGMGGGAAVTLDGSNGAVVSAATTVLSSISADCWFNTTSVAGGGIINGYDNPFVVYMLNNGDVVFGMYDGANTNVITTGTAYNDGNWHHVAAVYDNSTFGMVLYVDGAQQGTLSPGSGISAPGQTSFWYAGYGYNTAVVWPGTSTSEYLAGSIADVAVYPAALTSTQVSNHWSAATATVPVFAQNVDPPPRPPGFIPGVPGMPLGEPFQAWPYSTTVEQPPPPSRSGYQIACLADSPAFFWPLNETAGTTAADISGNGHNGTYAGTYAQAAAGPPGGGMGGALADSLTGNATSATGGHVTSGVLTNFQTVSAEIWFKTSTVTGGALIQAQDVSFIVYLTNSGTITLGVFDGSVSTCTTAGTFNDGNWHYLVATYNSATHAQILYIDNVSVATTSTAGSISAGSGLWYTGDGGNFVGNWPGTVTNNDPTAVVADFAVYPVVLTSTQIGNHWAAAAGPPAAAAVTGYRPVSPRWFPGAPGMPGGVPFRQWPVPADPGAPAGAVMLPGAATLGGAGSLTTGVAQGVPATLSGAGSLSTGVTLGAPASLNGAGSLTAAVTEGAPVTLAGAGSLTAPDVTLGAGKTLAGAGSLTAPNVTLGVTAALAGAGSLTAAVVQQATATLNGAGSLTAPVTQGVTATLAGAGSLTAAAGGSGAGAATLNGAGSLTAPDVVEGVIAALNGAGSLTATGTQGAGATLAGAGSLTAPDVTQGAGKALAGAGSLTAPDAVQGAGAGLAGAGSLTAPDVTQAAGATLNGAGSLTAAVVQQVTALLAGAGSLTAFAGGAVPGASTLNGAGSLTAPDVVEGAGKTLAGAGSLNALALQQAAAALAGAGSLTAAARLTLAAGASLNGAGSLTAAGVLQLAFTIGRPASAAAPLSSLTADAAPLSSLTAGTIP